MKIQITTALICLVALSACGTVETPDLGPTDTQQAPAAASPTSEPSSTPSPDPTSTQEPPAAESPFQEPKILQGGVEKFSSIPFREEPAGQTLDVYLPGEGEGPFPAFIGIHGGGFQARSKAMYGTLGYHFAQNGFAFIAIDYRLAPRYSYPAQVEDSFCALAWLHANHDAFRLDPDRVVVTGGSAGGYLAAMVATVDDPSIYLENCPNELPSDDFVHAAVIFYGLYDFTNAAEDFPAMEVSGLLEDYWGASYADLSSVKLAEMSPIAQIDGSEPPFLILHGTADTSIPAWKSERFAAALEQAGVDVELVLIEGAGHAFELEPLDGEEMTISINRMIAFLERVFTP